jgi:ribosomal protein S18 acetylase RimI-like enzyme
MNRLLETLPMTTAQRHALTLNLNIVFRLADRSDLPKLEWGSQYVHFRRMFQETYSDQLANRRLMLLADLDGYPVGQIFIQLDSPSGWLFSGRRGYLYSLRVIEPLQRHGIGTALISEAERLLIQRQHGTVSIAAAKDNPDARRLYERLAYKVVSEDDGRWSYIDHHGRTQHVVEPCWILEKYLR